MDIEELTEKLKDRKKSIYSKILKAGKKIKKRKHIVRKVTAIDELTRLKAIFGKRKWNTLKGSYW